MDLRKTTIALATAFVVVAVVPLAPVLGQGSSPLNEQEEELQRVESEVLELQRELSAARKRGDDPEEVRKLEKKFEKLQKKRFGLLRQTWRM
jgi:peptidoglycan hydrolase CwlO-like protein